MTHNTFSFTGRKAVIYGDPSLTHLVNEARRAPMLTAAEELDLTRRWRNGDQSAQDKLVRSHIRLVIKMASRYGNYGLPMADLVSEGHVGLVTALSKFDPERGFRVATYASWWIDAMLKTYIISNWSLVKVGTTADQKKLFFGLRRAKGKLSAYQDGDLTPEAVATIAHDLDVDAKEVVAMNRRLSGDRSLNTPLMDGDGEMMDLLPDEGSTAEETVAELDEGRKREEVLRMAVGSLTAPRERDIFLKRRLEEDPTTLEDLAKVYGVSRERIRQIEVKAVQKVTEQVARLARARGLLPTAQAA